MCYYVAELRKPSPRVQRRDKRIQVGLPIHNNNNNNEKKNENHNNYNVIPMVYSNKQQYPWLQHYYDNVRYMKKKKKD